jgi:hypothetical protein
MQQESGEVEEEGFDGAGGRKGERAGLFGLNRIARRKLHAVDLDFAADELKPQSPALTEFMRDRAGRRSLYAIDIRVLTDVRRTLSSVVGDDEHLGRGELLDRRSPLSITWTEAGAIGLDPDLDEMKPVGLRGIILAVLHPAAGAHDLDLAGLELGVIAKAVAVLDGPFEDIREDFHVPVPVRRETHPRVDEVLVDDPQGPETHVGGVVIIGEAEAVPGHQPAVIGEPTLLRAAHCELHIWPK